MRLLFKYMETDYEHIYQQTVVKSYVEKLGDVIGD